MNTNWYKKVISVVRWPTIAFGGAATSILGAAGHADQARADAVQNSTQIDPLILPNSLNSTALDIFAAHSSHRSHGSHRSHRSSSGGGYSRPAPQPTPQTEPPADTAPNKTVPDIPKPAPVDISRMAVRVQAALMRLGYFKNDIDGVLGPNTREAIKRFQKDKGLPESGIMDIQTLTALGISIP